MASVGLLAQYAVITCAVAASAAYLLQRQWPEGVRRMRAALAIRLLRMGTPRGAQRLARWIAPPARGASACGGCNGCSPGAGAG